MRATTTPKSDTPSIRAQAIIIAVWILLDASGWRAMPSIACLPMVEIPYAHPITVSAAPILDKDIIILYFWGY